MSSGRQLQVHAYGCDRVVGNNIIACQFEPCPYHRWRFVLVQVVQRCSPFLVTLSDFISYFFYKHTQERNPMGKFRNMIGSASHPCIRVWTLRTARLCSFVHIDRSQHRQTTSFFAAKRKFMGHWRQLHVLAMLKPANIWTLPFNRDIFGTELSRQVQLCHKCNRANLENSHAVLHRFCTDVVQPHRSHCIRTRNRAWGGTGPSQQTGREGSWVGPSGARRAAAGSAMWPLAPRAARSAESVREALPLASPGPDRAEPEPAHGCGCVLPRRAGIGLRNLAASSG